MKRYHITIEEVQITTRTRTMIYDVPDGLHSDEVEEHADKNLTDRDLADVEFKTRRDFYVRRASRATRTHFPIAHVTLDASDCLLCGGDPDKYREKKGVDCGCQSSD